MERIENGNFDTERAFYGRKGLEVSNCTFDGPADGESAFKECADVAVDHCYFNLRYPFWHDTGLSVSFCELTPLCRAALWYSSGISLTDATMNGIKALRECSDVSMERCTVNSAEFGWFTRAIFAKDCTFAGEYAMMRSLDLSFKNVRLDGKYSFQYIENASFENCEFYTKDAFWHAKNVTVKNSLVKGEYLGWYCENVTFENCTLIGTQPLCYCKNLKLINCKMEEADLAFEKSEVEATLCSEVISVKNPACGHIRLKGLKELIMDDQDATGRVEIV
jgi:hypothetical protein